MIVPRGDFILHRHFLSFIGSASGPQHGLGFSNEGTG